MNAMQPVTTADLIKKLQEVETANGGPMLVKIDGIRITSTDLVPAESGDPAYFDIVGL